MKGLDILERKIDVSHLIYIIIIFIIVLSFFLVISFGGSSSANSTMGTASTVSSLILSVVAIVLSLIDVAGQRQSVFDLKETAENLKKSNDKSIKQINYLQESLVEVSELKESLMNQIKQNVEWQEDIARILEQSRKKVNENVGEPEDLKNVIRELNEKFDKVTESIKPSKNVGLNSIKNLSKYRILISIDDEKNKNLNLDNFINEMVVTFNLKREKLQFDLMNKIIRLTIHDCTSDFNIDTGVLVSILHKHNMNWISDGFTI